MFVQERNTYDTKCIEWVHHLYEIVVTKFTLSIKYIRLLFSEKIIKCGSIKISIFGFDI